MRSRGAGAVLATIRRAVRCGLPTDPHIGPGGDRDPLFAFHPVADQRPARRSGAVHPDAGTRSSTNGSSGMPRSTSATGPGRSRSTGRERTRSASRHLGTAETTLTFHEPGEIAFICHVPGHEAYGMVGTLTVT